MALAPGRARKEKTSLAAVIKDVVATVADGATGC